LQPQKPKQYNHEENKLNGGQSVDPGIEPHKKLDRVNHPESFYDLEALGKMMDEYYKK